MRLRAATPADEPALAALCACAFFNDDLFGRTIHPYRAAYPLDVQLYWHTALRENWASPRTRIVVVVDDDDGNDDNEIIIGLAVWERQGEDAGAYHVISEHTPPAQPWPALPPLNRAIDASRQTILQDAEPFIKHLWAGARASNWYLALCCVDPRVQRRGCGRVLVEWGLERARREGVRASVIASEGNTGFYLACGFGGVVGNAARVGGEANPLVRAGVKGGDVLFTFLEGEMAGGEGLGCIVNSE